MSNLAANSYGKSRVRISQIQREGKVHTIRQLEVAVELEGDFLDTYETGDNSKVVATDSMKNMVNVFGRTTPIDSIEGWAKALATHIVGKYSHVSKATVSVEEELWTRIVNKGKPDPHAFVGGGSERPCTSVSASRKGVSVASGIRGLLVLRTTDSEFVGYITDEYTTLPPTKDRIFSTVIAADWKFTDDQFDWNDCRQKIRTALVETYADHYSLSVQQTLLAMGRAALAACGCIREITLELPNKHHLPINMKPFNLDNPNVVFTPTDEPHGLIKGTIAR